MEGFVVGGEYADIKDYPYSAFLSVTCVTSVYKRKLTSHWICGSSVVNQDIVLTAAHCLENCLVSSYVYVAVGNRNRIQGVKSSAKKFILHSDYNTNTLYSDIALVSLKTKLKLNDVVKRIALQKSPPYNEVAFIAGWGKVDEINNIGTIFLKFTNQSVLTRNECSQVLNDIPRGCICAGSLNGEDYASGGDSGSALIVRGYIQIGIVSFKMPSLSRSITVYSDIGYFYDWIAEQAKKLYCNEV